MNRSSATETSDDAADLVVIGSGIAGLVAALAAAPRARVTVVTKGALDDGCSRWAQGGIAAAVASDDAPDLHYADTIAAGRGLCDEAAVRVLVEEGPRRVRDLVDWGVSFDTQDGDLLLGREAAHTRSRILHARGDATGLEIESTLIARLRSTGARLLERHLATRLLTDGAGRCLGGEVCDGDTGAVRRLLAGAVVLASGGAGRLWRHTTNPPPATGDGVALAFDAGAECASMEFVQFHPTALALDGAPRFLISEAVRGEGARVVNARGERFLLDADPRGELAPRDTVSQAIWHELQRSAESCVYLDCSPLADRAAVRFPTIHRTCMGFGIDMSRDLVPIAPAAHYLIGGVRTDLAGATSIEGLYACGEVASSGVHGANRLASNSLLESVVFARRAAEAALRLRAEAPPPLASAVVEAPLPAAARPDDPRERARLDERLREAMWEGAGLVRDAASLAAARSVADGILAGCEADGSVAAAGLRARALTATLICDSALAREESRGCHLRDDFPDSGDEWLGIWVTERNRGLRFDSNARTHHH
ncbi:MAG: L-aspartate oxidase [Chloroflexi bacterium]|nr:MAG: L-aspartate oxidase [Chloroflexota bacterium]